jgi:regulator of cell morphogenesis and NO signaling
MSLQCELSPLADRSVTAVIHLFPQALDVLEDAGIQFCCHGARSLGEAAASAGFTADELMSMIEAKPLPPDPIDWSQRPLPELTEFLSADHKDLALQQLPRMREIVEREIAMHPHVPRLRRIRMLLADLASMLTSHMAHEEHDLYPWIATAERSDFRMIRFGQRVLREHVEHRMVCERLRTMVELSARLQLQNGDLYRELLAFSRPIHRHIHLENNILYPRAIEIENRLRSAS